ncbi:hypothetical protein B0H34DRAFT_259043 [Crassisporium funariophilum]|nr:hypothetical protein B0H34DRAFT_259043 [Crassisporium funariophilum]
MPRADSKQHLGTQFYHSQFSNSQYLTETASASPPMSPVSVSNGQQTPSTSTTAAPKKKHVCGTCERAFTTSGHLARHSRVHTGERNHKCPFPGCETRCSRQDNLQQHYRIHLSPGSRRSSARSAASRAMSGKRGSTASTETPSAPPPLSSPPALEPARPVYSHDSTPPDSPPPLAQATLPATASMPLNNARMDSSSRSSSSSSPEASYSPGGHHHMVSLSSQGLSLSNNNSQSYNYRSGTTTYQEQSQGAGFTYVHTTPISHSSGSSNGNSFPSYSGSHDNFSNHNVSSMQQQNQNRDHSPVSMSSRHSISHISHPQTSYSQTQSSSTSPPSPASSHSVSSHTSGPPTPTYPVFHDEAHSYHHGNNMIADHSGLNNSHRSHIVHNNYANGVQNAGRFDSPPPILAPIQDERLVPRDERHSQSHSSSPYIHHPQPLPTEYPYHQNLGLGHGAWKAESGMRKGVGAALV